MTFGKRILKLHPAALILGSFLLLIVIGTIGLKIPISTPIGHISWMDALFTATSAVCVTGLAVLDTGRDFTIFGQCVILLLIQIGGLGVMTVSVALFHWLGRTISFRHRMVMQETFAHTPRKDIYSLLQSIFIFTGITELLGAILLTVFWSRRFPVDQAVWLAVFHSVSAFCNAGFSLFANSLMDFRDLLSINLIICTLIILGGIGFPVVHDLVHYLFRSGQRRVKLSIQTKTVLTTTGVLILSGTFLYMILEQGHSLKGSGLGNQILYSFFQSVTSRTAGFNTLDLAGIGNAGAMLLMLLMFIGASPGSCAGGIKTTTLTVLLVAARCRMKGNYRPNLFKKSISDVNIMKSLSIVGLSAFFVLVIFFLLLISQSSEQIAGHAGGDQFRILLFEVISAFGTVGLSMGATSVINGWGKMLLIIMMLIGRVGVISFAYVLIINGNQSGIEYVEENMMLG